MVNSPVHALAWRPVRPLHTRRYLRRQHLLLGLYLLLLARCHFLELSKGQIHPRTINLEEKTRSHVHG